MPQVPHTEPAITPHQALIYVMIMASAVDRIMSDAEMEQIGLIVRRLPAFQDYNKNRLVKTAQACRDSLARHEGFTQTLTLIEGALSKDLHVTAMPSPSR